MYDTRWENGKKLYKISLQIFYGPLQDSMTLVTAECVSGDIMFRDRWNAYRDKLERKWQILLISPWICQHIIVSESSFMLVIINLWRTELNPFSKEIFMHIRPHIMVQFRIFQYETKLSSLAINIRRIKLPGIEIWNTYHKSFQDWYKSQQVVVRKAAGNGLTHLHTVHKSAITTDYNMR